MRAIAQSGTGIILVTHNLHDIIPEITRVVTMKDGRIFGDGEKTAMLTDEKIGRLFSVPVHVREEDGWYYATGYERIRQRGSGRLRNPEKNPVGMVFICVQVTRISYLIRYRDFPPHP